MIFEEPTILKVRKHEVFVERKITPVTVMVTGDWHISPIVSQKQFEFLEQAIEVAKPDLIILQGDIVDSPLELKRETSVKKLFKELTLCSKAAPTVMVLGTHDYITPTRIAKSLAGFAIPRMKKICEKCNVTLLFDEFFELPAIRVFGAFQDEKCTLAYRKDGLFSHFDNTYEFEKKLSKFDFSDLGTDKVNWFASHAPMINEKVAEDLAGFDILSFGHTHGGIVPRGIDDIFDQAGVNFGFISPHGTPFNSLARGMRAVGDGSLMLINTGMTGASFNAPRVLQKMNAIKAAEVSVVEIKNRPEAETE